MVTVNQSRLPYSLLTIAIAALAFGCSKPEVPQELPRPVLSRVVHATPDGATAVYAGEIRARHENDLAFRIGGKVVSRNVEVGSVVRKGQLLARLDPQDVQLQGESARAQTAVADTEVTWARAELERYQALREKNFVSQAVLDQKKQAFDAAEAKLRQNKAQLAVSTNQTSYASLIADTDGVITLANIEPGQVVAPGQSVIRIARQNEKEVLISVPEGRVADLRKASALAITLWSDPSRRYAGQVREIAPSADATTRTFAARIRVINADDAVSLGVTANVVVGGDPTISRIVVPLTAVGDREGKPVVWVVDPTSQQVASRSVTVVGYRENGAVIAQGLEDGERVVVVGVQKLREAQTVRLASESELKSFVGTSAQPGRTESSPSSIAVDAPAARQTVVRTISESPKSQAN
ncbi:MAG: efflux RND transporter periplasmic adaptor subunit [Burkholderiales bacterium]